MDLWNRTFSRFTLIEWLVAVVVLLVLARFFWAEEILSFEDGLFESVGLGGGAKYLITVPLGIWVYYRVFKREQASAREKGIKVVRPQVLVVAIGLLALAIGILLFSAL